MPILEDSLAAELLCRLLAEEDDMIQFGLSHMLEDTAAVESPVPGPSGTGNCTPLSVYPDAIDDIENNSDSSYKPSSDESDSDSSTEHSEDNESEASTICPASVSPEPACERNRSKRPRNKTSKKESWEAVQKKKLRMEGKAYTGSKKNVVTRKNQAEEKRCREQGPPCTSSFCLKSKYRHCHEIIQEDRTALFQQFWSNMDWGQRKTYVASLVDFVPTKQQGKPGTRRRRQIFWPAEYVEAITSARESQPYKVVQVDHTFVKDFSDLRYYQSIRPGTASGDPQVVDIRCLKYLPDGTLHYKLHYSDEWQPLPQRRRRAHGDPGVINQLYRARLPIKDTKWQHLQQPKEVLPADYHYYYDGLPHGC
ncbi:hypothetical protein V1264_013352 [Littorina saxatilis]|uniref:Uncharacterized protein n=1 Tax=Littorina saxatilis TaxID=31220 RepID=A0AAN9BT96_9CAEN